MSDRNIKALADVMDAAVIQAQRVTVEARIGRKAGRVSITFPAGTTLGNTTVMEVAGALLAALKEQGNG